MLNVQELALNVQGLVLSMKMNVIVNINNNDE